MAYVYNNQPSGAGGGGWGGRVPGEGHGQYFALLSFFSFVMMDMKKKNEFVN